MTPKRLGFLPAYSTTPRRKSAINWRRSRSATRNGWALIAPGWRNTIHENEGGLPSPLVFLAHAAAHTQRIRLGTAIITLPMENPLRVAEDAAVLDLLAEGRLEVGFGSGGTPTSFLPFGLACEQRGAVFADHLHLIEAPGAAIRWLIRTIIFIRLRRSWQNGFGSPPFRLRRYSGR